MTSVEGEERAAGRRRTKSRKQKNPHGEMPLREHLTELRNRILISAVAIALGSIVGFLLYEPIFTALVAPVVEAGKGRLSAVTFDSVGAPFDIMLQVSMFIGLLVSSPVWLYQIWAFVMPGLKKNEKRYALGFLGAAIPLFLAGVGLGWLVMPQAVQFFIQFSPANMPNLIPAQSYIPFVLRLFLAFGASLVLPVFLVGLNMIGVLPGRTIVQHWRITVFGVALVAALAAPGSDAVSMFYLAVPLVLLFGASIVLCLLNDRRRARRAVHREQDVEAEIAAGPRSLDEI